MSRFKRIAHDLEKLPCELHEPILADLEFEQLIRLSRYAGDRLFSSLTNSRSFWGTLFCSGKTAIMQELLALTDEVKALGFVYGSPYQPQYLSFLQYHSADWESGRFVRGRSVYNPDTLCKNWLSRLVHLTVKGTWPTFHAQDEYSIFIEPWLSRMDGAIDIFEKFYFSDQTQSFQKRFIWGSTNNDPIASIDDLSQFIRSYQKLRLIRAKALAEELYRLADLYDVHGTRLRMPFSPQTRRPNLEHVSTRMRSEAARLAAISAHTPWNNGKLCQYRFAFPFPAIVPYDWSARLFDRVLQKHTLVDPVYPAAITRKCKFLLEQLPQWDVDAPVYVGIRPVADISESLEHLKMVDDSPVRMESLTDSLKVWTHRHTRKTTSLKQGIAYRTQPEAELKWLETFMEVVAWMEVEFPAIVQEVRGYEWLPDQSNKEETMARP